MAPSAAVAVSYCLLWSLPFVEPLHQNPLPVLLGSLTLTLMSLDI